MDPAAVAGRFVARLDALELLRGKLRAAKGLTVALLPHGVATADPVGERLRLAWAALEAIAGPQGALRLFDELRLRDGIAAALHAAGATDEDGWRGAARLRAGFAHSGMAPESGDAPDAAVVEAYLADPEVRWLLGATAEGNATTFDIDARVRETGWLRLPQLLARIQAALALDATAAVKRSAGPGTLAALAAKPIEAAAPPKAPVRRAPVRKPGATASKPTAATVTPTTPTAPAKPKATRRAK